MWLKTARAGIETRSERRPFIDHLIFKCNPLRIVLRKPCVGRVAVRKDLEVIAVADLPAGIDIDPDRGHRCPRKSALAEPGQNSTGQKVPNLARLILHLNCPVQNRCEDRKSSFLVDTADHRAKHGGFGKWVKQVH